MEQKKKENLQSNKQVKIVGVNHGFVLHHYIFADGWKKEQFVDVTFICQTSKSSIQTQGIKKNKICANRSILAATSPFFAGLLPKNELEMEICISIELTYDEMFCVLEYVYSGKLLCPSQNKDKILSILKDFGIFVPTLHQQVSLNFQSMEGTNNELISQSEVVANNCSQVSIPAGSSIGLLHYLPIPNFSVLPIPPIGKNGNLVLNSNLSAHNNIMNQLESNQNNSQDRQTNTPIISKTIGEVKNKSVVKKNRRLLPKPSINFINISPSLTCGIQTSAQNLALKPSVLLVQPDHASYKPTLFETTVPATDKAFSLNNTKNLTIQTVRDIQDKFIIQTKPKREDVTLILPSQILNHSRPLKDANSRSVPNNCSLFPRDSIYQLSDYHTDTWHLGIYSPYGHGYGPADMEQTDTTFAMNSNVEKNQSLTPSEMPSAQQPTFLTAKTKHVYSRFKTISSLANQQKIINRKNVAGLIIKTSDIETVKECKGKLHILLKQLGKPTQEQHISTNQIIENQLAQQIQRKNGGMNNSEDTSEDKDDLIQAKKILSAENEKKRFLRKKFKRLDRQLTEEKKMACLILKKLENMKAENFALKIPMVKKHSKKKKQCSICNKMVANMSDHLKIHKGIKSYLCDLCGRTFVLRTYLGAHKRSHHLHDGPKKSFVCNICGYAASSQSVLLIHERIHTGEKPYECKYCDKKFREKGTLNRHLRTHTGERPYACEICGKSYAARETYLGHYKRTHSNNSENIPRRFRSKKVLLRCDFCQKTFKRRLAYEKHHASHTGIAPSLSCAEKNCGFTYSDLPQLKAHMVECHPAKVYTCDVCTQVFFTKMSLMIHKARHDSSLCFQCSYCPTRVTTKASLIAHEKIHTRETPYECPVCYMRFHSTYRLNIHVRKIHEVRQSKRRYNPKENIDCTN